MRRQLILIFSLIALMVSSGTAVAGWVKLYESHDEGGKVNDITYVDPDTMSRTGDLVKVSFLIDFRKPYSSTSGQKSSSWIWDKEYDCRKRQHRYLRTAMYSGRMGKGTARFDKDADPDFQRQQKWSPIDSDVDDSEIPLFKYACVVGKR